jgi:hypothetical protein
MTSKTNLAMIVTSAALGVAVLGAAPAYAYTPQAAPQHYGGRDAFALVPGDPPAGPALHPGATGGGSFGYNWMVQHDY